MRGNDSKLKEFRPKTRRARNQHRNYCFASTLIVCLVLLFDACEGFVVTSTLKYSKYQSEVLVSTRRSRLLLTRTESPTESKTVNVSGSSQEALCFPCLSHEAALIMAKGDGAIDSRNEDEVEKTSDETNEDDSREDQPRTEDSQDEDELRRRTGAAAAALLRHKRGGVRPVKPLKSTSIGARRVGSATRARSNPRSTSRIMDTVRTVAGATASSKAQAPSETTNSTTANSETKQTESTHTSDSNVGSNVIQSTIASLLEGQSVAKADGGLSMNALPRPFGILGEEPDPLSHELLKKPMPGTMLLYPTIQSQEYRRPSRETLGVRVATPDDDFQIANLRLSVFSDFSSELRSQFCARSCQVLADRRLRGATCLVATCPSGRNAPSEIIVGSVECSVHEFHATKLGRRRPKHSSLYITEVAVSPSARRCGVGSKLLQGIDELATLRNVESLYLHVDVLNFGALELYRKAGYRKVHNGDPTFAEFTTSLNLHDGATKGRRHYLLYKNMVRNPTWLPEQEGYESRRKLSNINSATWGFEDVLS